MKNQDIQKQEQLRLTLTSVNSSFRGTARKQRSMKTQAWILTIVVVCAVFSSSEVSASSYTKEYDVTDFYWSSGFTNCSANVTVSLPDGAYINSVKVSGQSTRPTDKTVWLKAAATTYYRTINPPGADGTWTSSPFHSFDGTSYTAETYTITMRGFWHLRFPPGTDQVYPPHCDCEPYEEGSIKLIFDYTLY